MIIEKDKLLPEEASVVEVTISNLSQSPDLKRSPELHVENIGSNFIRPFEVLKNKRKKHG